MRTDFYSPGPPAPQTSERRVSDDLPRDMPVTDAELDVIEAFLGAQLRAILDGKPQEGEGRPAGGRKTCHNRGSIYDNPHHPAASPVSRE